MSWKILPVFYVIFLKNIHKTFLTFSGKIIIFIFHTLSIQRLPTVVKNKFYVFYTLRVIGADVYILFSYQNCANKQQSSC